MRRAQLFLVLLGVTAGSQLFPASFKWSLRGVSYVSPAGTTIGNATVDLWASPTTHQQTVTDEHNSPGPLWRPAGSFTDLTLFPKSEEGTKKTWSYHKEGKQCRHYATPRLAAEGGQGVAAAFHNATFAGYNNYTLGCVPSRVQPEPCEYYEAEPNLLGAKGLLWRGGAPVWLWGLGIYTNNWFYTLRYTPLSSSETPSVPSDWNCSNGCMAQINLDLSRCEEFYGDSECGSCGEVHQEWSLTAHRNCSDSVFDNEIDTEDTEQGWYCWCHNHTKCVDQDGPPGDFRCVPC